MTKISLFYPWLELHILSHFFERTRTSSFLKVHALKFKNLQSKIPYLLRNTEDGNKTTDKSRFRIAEE